MIALPSFLLLGFEGFAFFLLPLVPALVALYFLKLRRQEVPVSSTYLWKKSIEDMHVNSPFQKLRRSLLLLLQLLALAGLILAASRPIITGSGEGGRNILLLIDVSASMNSSEEGETRLDLARRKAGELVEGMVGGDRMAVIAFSSRTDVLQPLTADRSALRRAIAGLSGTSLPTDLLQALRTVEAIGGSLPAAEIHLVGDGAYGVLGSLPEELERFSLKFMAAGKEAGNLGITEVDVRRSFGARERAELFASVGNFTGEEKRAALGVYRGDRLLAAAELVLPPGRVRSHTFDASRFLDEGEEAADLRLEIDPGGILPDDDRAYVRLFLPRRLSVLVVGGENGFLDRALAAQTEVDARGLTAAEYRALASSGGLAADLARVIIFDREAPPELPDRPALYLGACPEALGPRARKEGEAPPPRPVVKLPAIVDWDRGHPVNRFLTFADLRIGESISFPSAPGYRSLIDTGDGSIAGVLTVEAEGKGPAPVLLLGFDPLRSNWPWLHSFPIFFGNALGWLGSEARSEAEPRYRIGEVLTYRPEGRKPADPAFRDPEGRLHRVSPEKGGALSFAGASRPGLYHLVDGGEVLETFPVSLLSASESDVAPRQELRFGSQVVEAQASTIETRDIWKPFALAALLFLVLEWWVYNRRMHV